MKSYKLVSDGFLGKKVVSYGTRVKDYTEPLKIGGLAKTHKIINTASAMEEVYRKNASVLHLANLADRSERQREERRLKRNH